MHLAHARAAEPGLFLQFANRCGLGRFGGTAIAVDQARRQFDDAPAHGWAKLLDQHERGLGRHGDHLHGALGCNHALHKLPAPVANQPQIAPRIQDFRCGVGHAPSINPGPSASRP